jgi:hypothetical protein
LQERRRYYNEVRRHGAIGNKAPITLQNHDGPSPPTVVIKAGKLHSRAVQRSVSDQHKTVPQLRIVQLGSHAEAEKVARDNAYNLAAAAIEAFQARSGLQAGGLGAGNAL